ncbi:general stress protein [Sphingomonas sp. AAP5]|jgi:general stress protein 26|uniref:General stress protein n=1 Tax=Sphingomonas glacialis TaxID=658225 RepID=A0ABQ3LSU9_9SPHN|nr:MULTISPECIES: pyridoxamine 5'-phosphate oxidase family protein [Sphingomonas]MDY7522771.1 pyridoxamine 5'-phosphate oxidase family protein [Sphingomonas sp. 10B4]MEB0282638.1 pyridoxamine 5'-phosphate oxidase family protein [Sphingomonas sp. 10B4]QBM74778.1 general stress protein [Sphingomonas sp. AAP5]GHH20071.1 general stress protein [Sphingomonas glacialis]
MADTHEITQTLWKKMADSPFLMVGLADGSSHSEPLTAQLDKDLVDTLFFFVGKDNRLIGGGKVMAQFVSKGHDFFACIAGTIAQDNDRAMIDKLWNKQVEAWFPGGKEDPNLALLRLKIDNAELWETDISLSGRLKMLFGGTIKSDESGSHAVVNTTAA